MKAIVDHISAADHEHVLNPIRMVRRRRSLLVGGSSTLGHEVVRKFVEV
jgi:hypothetical protein